MATMEWQHTCGGVAYVKDGIGPVHSDICIDGELSDEYKEFLRDCFGEFLDNFQHHKDSYFYIGGES